MRKIWTKYFKPILEGQDRIEGAVTANAVAIASAVARLDEMLIILRAMQDTNIQVASILAGQSKMTLQALDEAKRFFTAEREALERESGKAKEEPTEADLKF